MKKLIFLVGFMGVGKTYLGQKLAQQLYYDFVDTDQLIEAQYGQTIPEIFAAKGETTFRTYEREITHQLLDRERLIVATGGGLPCHNNMMATLRKAGTTIYLETAADTIIKRLSGNPANRPLLEGKTAEVQSVVIASLMEKRAPIYEKADYIFYLSGNHSEDEHDFLMMCRTESQK